MLHIISCHLVSLMWWTSFLPAMNLSAKALSTINSNTLTEVPILLYSSVSPILMWNSRRSGYTTTALIKASRTLGGIFLSKSNFVYSFRTWAKSCIFYSVPTTFAFPSFAPSSIMTEQDIKRYYEGFEEWRKNQSWL